MAFTEIDVSTILKEYPVPTQYGPLRQFEKAMSCMDGTKKYRCASPTHFKVNGVPKCMIHALRELNRMLYTTEEQEAANGG